MPMNDARSIGVSSNQQTADPSVTDERPGQPKRPFPKEGYRQSLALDE